MIGTEMSIQDSASRPPNRTASISNPAIYIIVLGWLAFGVYVLLFAQLNDFKTLLAFFLSPERDGIRFRALAFFTPFIFTVIGFLVNEREKHIQRLTQADTNLRQLNEALEQKVTERTIELDNALKKARAASEAKSQFIASVSHEIRTPMNGIIGVTELLTEAASTKEQRQYTDMIHDASTHMLTIINDLLDVSKIEAGQVTLANRPFLLSETLGEALASIKLMAESKGVGFDLRISPEVPDHLSGDPEKLAQVLINLAGNALKFTPQGEVNVSIEPHGDQPAPGMSSILFTVVDTGIGIPPDQTDNIFKAFTQAGPGITRRFGGTGLGLSISSHLVSLMGGKISVSSTVGQGSTFSFALSFAHPDSKAVDASQPVLRTGGDNQGFKRNPPLKVLIAEDYPIAQKITSRLLRNAGHSVTIATTGLEAVEALSLRPYDIILMDVQMPEMNGYEATRRIRQIEQPQGRHTIIIAMTAHAMAGDRERCIEAGMDDYISKPIKASELLRLIDKYAAP